MVAGKRIDDSALEALMAEVALVVAHNASFDRVFVEQRFPLFAAKPWACSFMQIPWSEEGFGSAKLEFLAYQSGFHYTGHRATTDCYALLEVLQQTLPVSQSKAMQTLLQNARQPEIKVSALNNTTSQSYPKAFMSLYNSSGVHVIPSASNLVLWNIDNCNISETILIALLNLGLLSMFSLTVFLFKVTSGNNAT